MQNRSTHRTGLRLLVAGALAFSGVAATQAPALAWSGPAGCHSYHCVKVDVQKDVVFGSGATLAGDLELSADIYSPDRPAPRGGWPAVVMLHGGYFTQGDKAEGPLPELATTLAERGFVVMSANYRLLTNGPVPQEPKIMDYLKSTPAYQTEQGKQVFPGLASAIEDSLAATTWLAENEDLNVNPNRISMVGESAGAITGLYATYLPEDIGLEAPKIQSIVDLWGGFVATPGQAELIDSGDAPVMVVHGTDDDVLEFGLAESIRDRTRSEWVRNWVFEIEGGKHGWSQNSLDSRLPHTRWKLVDGITYFLKCHSWCRR